MKIDFKNLIYSMVLAFVATTICLNADEVPQIANMNGSLYNSSFIENKGQWNEDVKYMANVAGGVVWILEDGIQYDLSITESLTSNTFGGGQPNDSTRTYRHKVKMEFVESNENPTIMKSSKNDLVLNYFIGGDSTKWAKDVATYSAITLKNLFEGIDIKYYFDENQGLRYDYIVNVGANPSNIQFKILGADSVSIPNDTTLEVTTRLGKFSNGELFAYQHLLDTNGSIVGKTQIACSFQDSSGVYKYNIETYDTGKTLIIDPYVDTEYYDLGQDFLITHIKFDNNDVCHLFGMTIYDNYDSDIDYSECENCSNWSIFQATLDSKKDIKKMSIYGGSSDDNLSGVEYLPSQDKFYIYGYTNSCDLVSTEEINEKFPTTNNAYMSNFFVIHGACGYKCFLFSANHKIYESTLLGPEQDAGGHIKTQSRIIINDDQVLVSFIMLEDEEENIEVVNIVDCDEINFVDAMYIYNFSLNLESVTNSMLSCDLFENVVGFKMLQGNIVIIGWDKYSNWKLAIVNSDLNNVLYEYNFSLNTTVVRMMQLEIDPTTNKIFVFSQFHSEKVESRIEVFSSTLISLSSNDFCTDDFRVMNVPNQEYSSISLLFSDEHYLYIIGFIENSVEYPHFPSTHYINHWINHYFHLLNSNLGGIMVEKINKNNLNLVAKNSVQWPMIYNYSNIIGLDLVCFGGGVLFEENIYVALSEINYYIGLGIPSGGGYQSQFRNVLLTIPDIFSKPKMRVAR